MKKIIFLLSFVFFSCSLEHLIFMRNLKKFDFDITKQILVDIGIVTNVDNRSKQLSDDKLENEPLQVEKKIPVENKLVKIKNNNIFTIKLPEKEKFIVLKSIEGDTTFSSNDSKIEEGIFVFTSGKKDSKIRFEVFDLNGDLKKRVNYFVNIIIDTNIEKKKEEVTQQKTKTIETTNIVTNEGAIKTSIGIKGVIQSIKKDLPYAEAINEYEKMINSPELTEEEKDLVKYNLIELLLERNNFEKAQNIINSLRNEGRKLYYNALLNTSRKREREAFIQYRDALTKSDNETKKLVIAGLLELLKKNKLASLEEVEDLEKNISKFKNEKEFYANSMIAMSELYVYFEKVYKAEEILKSIIEGEYNESLKKKARGVYKDLREGFIEYR